MKNIKLFIYLSLLLTFIFIQSVHAETTIIYDNLTTSTYKIIKIDDDTYFNGTLFPNSTNFKSVLSITQNDVTASRVKDTIYQNTAGKPMWVNAMFAFSAKSTIIAYSDENSAPTTVVALHTMEAFTYGGVSFIVLPNNYYKVVLGAGGVNTIQWIEWY